MAEYPKNHERSGLFVATDRLVVGLMDCNFYNYNFVALHSDRFSATVKVY